MTKAASRARVLFLFNHDAAHQATHIIGIAVQLARTAIDVEVIAACGTPAILTFIQALVPEDLRNTIEWKILPVPRRIGRLLSPLNAVAPVNRLLRLYHNKNLFAAVDVVVSTERTCLRVKRKLGKEAPKFAYVPHGSGDRNVAYHPELKQFDLFLLSGQKLADEMFRHGIAQPEQCRLIGYPKFDVVDRTVRQRFFHNENPIFLYNPHFDPYLSSWYNEGLDILEFFRNNADRYNLIFAPHVMLFRKKLHYSLEYRTARVRPDIPHQYVDAPNILVDTDSPRLFDMSYTLAADVYIGDVSSQVYEFLIRPRACYFLDVHSAGVPQGEPAYEFWRNGEVCRSATELAARIDKWSQNAARYHDEQRRLFAYSIDDLPDMPATLRGARAIADYARDVTRT